MKKDVFRIIKIGAPLLFAQLTHYFHQIADSAMLGHFGEGSDELAAMSIAGLYTWILNTLIWPLSNGVQAITAQRFGRQAEDTQLRAHTGEALDNGIIIAICVVALALGLSFLSRPILSALIQKKEILELALQYIKVVRFSLPPIGMFFIIQAFLGAINKTAYVMWTGLISNTLNVILNYLFIFGFLNFPAMGIRGAALGTVISWIVSALIMLIILFVRGYVRNYRLFTFHYLSRNLQWNILKISLPPCVQNIIALSIFMIYQAIIEDYSTILLAATHIAFSYFRLNKTLIGGFARGAGILIGNALGRHDRKDAKNLMTASGFIATLIASLLVLITILGRTLISSFFSSDLQTQYAAVLALLFFTVFFFFESLGYTFEMIFIANGYGRYVLVSEVLTNFVFIIGTTLLSRFLFPDQIYFAWLSFGLYQIAHAIFMFVGYRRGKWLEINIERNTDGK